MRHVIWLVLVLIAIALGSLFGIYRHYKGIGKLSKKTGFVGFLLGKGREKETPVPQHQDKQTEQGGQAEQSETAELAETAEQAETAEPSGQVTSTQSENASETGVGTEAETEAAASGDAVRRQFDERCAAAGEAYRLAEFSRAVRLFTESGEFYARTGGKDAEQSDLLERMRLRSQVFAALIENMPVDRFVDGENLVEVTLTGSKQPFYARLVAKTEAMLTVEKESGLEARLPLAQVKSMTVLTKGNYRKRRIVELDQRVKSVEEEGSPNYNDYFHCAVFAVRYNLAARVTELLEKAFSLPGSEELIGTFIYENELELTVALLQSFEREDEAATFAGLLEEERGKRSDAVIETGGTGKAVAGNKSSTGAAGVSDPLKTPEWIGAEELYKTGYAYWVKSFPGTPDHYGNLKESEDYFRQAQELLIELGKRFPGNGEIDRRLTEINEKLFDIYIRLPLKPSGEVEPETPVKKAEPPAGDASGKDDPTKTEDFAVARSLYERGCEVLGKFDAAKPGDLDNENYLDDSERRFKEALKILEALERAHPGNPEVEKLAGETKGKLAEIAALREKVEK